MGEAFKWLRIRGLAVLFKSYRQLIAADTPLRPMLIVNGRAAACRRTENDPHAWVGAQLPDLQ
jgi:hypothetical protein